VDTLSLGVNLFFLISESKMSANTRTLPSPLLFYARSGSLLFKFIQVNHGNPVRITIEDVEQLIIKYCLKKMLRDVTNPYVVWPDIVLSNILDGCQAYHSTQLPDMLK